MSPQRPDLLQGTLDLLVLRILQEGPLHGWAVARRIEQLSRDVLTVGQGSLYPALYRLEDRGLARAEWGVSDEGRRVKLYSLTPKGRRAFEDEKASWRALAAAVEHVLEAPA